MDQLHTANKVCGGCCAISLNTVDTESSVSPIKTDIISIDYALKEVKQVNFKHNEVHLNRSANQSKASCGVSLGKGNESLYNKFKDKHKDHDTQHDDSKSKTQ